MQIIAGTCDFRLPGKSAVAIGKFDGIHLGHKELLRRILAKKEQGITAVVLTFDPPPEVFFGKREQKELTTLQEKRDIFRQMGIDVLIEYPLDAVTAAVEPRAFVTDILVKQMHMVYLAAGYDISFGDKGMGNAALLKELSPALGYELDIVEKICLEEKEISSTYVREQIELGNMETATNLLGEPYSLIGEVMHGAKLGRNIGMPTINLLPESSKLLPPNGVYFSYVKVFNKTYKGVTNIGKKPTVSNENQIGVETYIYDFDKDVYGKTVTVNLLHFRRPEMKFSGIEELKAQMFRDMDAGRAYAYPALSTENYSR